MPQKDVSALEADANVKVYRVDGVVRDHVGFNMQSDLFRDNPNLRKAIGWAIDRETIVNTIMFGLASPAKVAILKSHWAYDPAVEGAYGFALRAEADGRLGSQHQVPPGRAGLDCGLRARFDDAHHR